MQPLPIYEETPPPPRWIAYAELLRLPLAATLAGLTLAGTLLAGARFPTLPALLAAILAASALAAGTSALHDLQDYERDRRDRPERALPAGRISLPEARVLAWGLIGAGLILALIASVTSLPAVTLWLAARLLFDAGARRFFLLSFVLPAVPFPAALWLGIAAVPEAWLDHPLPLATVAAYALAVTLLREPLRTPSLPVLRALAVATLHLLFAGGLLVWQAFTAPFVDPLGFWPFFVILFLNLAPGWTRIFAQPTRRSAEVTAHLAALGSLWVGAALAGAYAGLASGVLVGLLYFPVLALAQRLRV